MTYSREDQGHITIIFLIENESVFYKNAVYLYTKNGVLKYSPSFYSGLNNIESNQLTESADYYDLKGIKIIKPQKGQIYIKEGEKFIFK